MSETSSTLDRPSLWHDWHNAAVYQSYVDEFPIYGWLNRELVRVSHLPGGSRILDLACGTGATALACLPAMDRDAELVGVDSARPMVEIARAEVRDPRCRFVVSDARQIGRHLDGRFDRAVCNASFWHFPDPAAVLAELWKLLLPGSWLSFSVPTQYLAPESTTAHPFQLAVARQLGRRARLADDPERGPFSSIESLKDLLRAGGFHPDRVSEARYYGRQQELVDLMRIPAMADSITDGLAEDETKTVIARAAEEVDLDQRVVVPWTFVTAVR